MSLFQNLLLDTLTNFTSSIIMDSMDRYQNSNDTTMEISFQLDPGIHAQSVENSSNLSTDIDLTDFLEMENVNLDDLVETDITINSDSLDDLNIPFSRLLGLCLQSLLDIDDFYLQYELPVSVLDFLEAINNPPAEKHPVPEEVLNSFPIIKMDLDQLSKNDECPICLAKFSWKEEAMRLLCNHYYHERCIKKWFQEQNFCPVCRQEV